jgi:hypothetical protein
MSFSIDFFILVCIFLFLIYCSYKIYKIFKIKINLKNNNLEKKDNLSVELREDVKTEITEDIEIVISKSQLYSLQTHKVKYLLFDAKIELKYLSDLYQIIIINNYWISQPFHDKFYEFLKIIDANNFMIIDPNSKIISMNIRDKNNEVQTSKSYQVFSTKDIIHFIIRNYMSNIYKYDEENAKNIIISIFVIVLEKSVHHISKLTSLNIIDDLLKDYKYSENVKIITELVKERNSSLNFINEAFTFAFKNNTTFPYNDTEVPKQLQISNKSSIKSLQNI